MLTILTGWRPRRTIIFASWDAEEFGLLGSTEWAEVNKTKKVLIIIFFGQQGTKRYVSEDDQNTFHYLIWF